MNILMICTEKLPVPPVLGGAIQTYIAGALPYLSKQHTITVLGVNDPSLPDEEMIDGVRYVRVPGKVFEVYREAVMSFVATETFDLIHIFNRPRLVLPIRTVAPQSKITLSMHNDMFQPAKIDPDMATAALNEVSRIVTVSDYVGNVIRELYPQADQKISTIYSGVDINRFLPGDHSKMKSVRNQLRRENDLEGKTVLLFAGRLSRNKGVDKLVQALPELAKKHKDLALVIVGSKWFSQEGVTDYVAYVRALANRLPVPVVTTGFISPADIQQWYAAADVFVCTSIWQEPLARVHYEAMAAGLPIVTTARGGNPEVIVEGENGLIVEDPTDPNQFVNKVDQVLSNRSSMKKMGQYGRAMAESKFTWDRVGAQILEMWTRAVTEEVDLETNVELEAIVEYTEPVTTTATPSALRMEPVKAKTNQEPIQEPMKEEKVKNQPTKPEQSAPVQDDKQQHQEETVNTVVSNSVKLHYNVAIDIWGDPLSRQPDEDDWGREDDVWGDEAVNELKEDCCDNWEKQPVNPFDK
ncbi:glycosyltransferase family 4 protein [Pontibacillus salicampi]|uniref:Glycosyltransferase family 4 protein n=1 Tax=Pontibacillus salicampi TaxID=1449801 RepID=A0ABV6LQE6_9BACI